MVKYFGKPNFKVIRCAVGYVIFLILFCIFGAIQLISLGAFKGCNLSFDIGCWIMGDDYLR